MNPIFYLVYSLPKKYLISQIMIKSNLKKNQKNKIYILYFYQYLADYIFLRAIKEERPIN